MTWQPATSAPPAKSETLNPAPTSPEPNGLPEAKVTSPPNGAPSPSPSRLPRAQGSKRGLKLLLIGTAVLLIGAGSGGGWYWYTGVRTSRPDLITHTVTKAPLQLTVVERGALESAENSDVYCRVKSGAKNSTVATTI